MSTHLKVIACITLTCALTLSAEAACVYPQKNLRQGARDTARDTSVAMLQQFLNGRYPGTIVNGYFGPKTRTTVMRFQKDYKLPQTGTVGPQTRTKMQQLCGNAQSNEALNELDTGPSCKVLYDGCNVCTRDEVGGVLRCTMRACAESKFADTTCKSFFNGTHSVNVPAVDTKETVCAMEHKPVCGTPYRCLTDENLKDSMPRECTHGSTFKNKCVLDAEKALFLHDGSCAQ